MRVQLRAFRANAFLQGLLKEFFVTSAGESFLLLAAFDPLWHEGLVGQAVCGGNLATSRRSYS